VSREIGDWRKAQPTCRDSFAETKGMSFVITFKFARGSLFVFAGHLTDCLEGIILPPNYKWGKCYYLNNFIYKYCILAIDEYLNLYMNEINSTPLIILSNALFILFIFNSRFIWWLKFFPKCLSNLSPKK
jgi:hypothetical protein